MSANHSTRSFFCLVFTGLRTPSGFRKQVVPAPTGPGAHLPLNTPIGIVSSCPCFITVSNSDVYWWVLELIPTSIYVYIYSCNTYLGLGGRGSAWRPVLPRCAPPPFFFLLFSLFFLLLSFFFLLLIYPAAARGTGFPRVYRG